MVTVTRRALGAALDAMGNGHCGIVGVRDRNVESGVCGGHSMHETDSGYRDMFSRVCPFLPR